MSLLCRQFRAVVIASVTASILGCHGEKNGTSNIQPTPNEATMVFQAPPLVNPDAQIVIVWQSQQSQLSIAVTAAENLLSAIETLLLEPTDEHLQHSKDLWWTTLDAIAPTSLASGLSKTIQAPAATNINRTFGYITRWPTHLGYLDESTLQGKTGLIFDLDTPITIEVLREQHGLTSIQDATLGLYPLGAILYGANGSRTTQDLTPISLLSESDRVMGFTTTNELAANRRRQLLLLQAQLLVEDLKSVQVAWERRDRNSALNALSQTSIGNQHRKCLQAAQQIIAQQIMELKSAPEKQLGHTEEFSLWTQQLRNKRWHAQLKGIELWLSLLEEPQIISNLVKLQDLLEQTNSQALTANLKSEDKITASTALNDASSGSQSSAGSLPQSALDSNNLDVLMASIALDLKTAIEKIPTDNSN